MTSVHDSIDVFEIRTPETPVPRADQSEGTIDTVTVSWGDATKHRQILTTAAGVEVRLQLPRGSFLADGCVLWAEAGTRIVVRRPPEAALVVRFADNADDPHLHRHLVRLGYTLGNQHAPIELTDDGIATPLFTGADAALTMLASLGITGTVESIPLARHGWSNTSADNHGLHHHD